MQSFISFFYDHLVDELIADLKSNGWECREGYCEKPEDCNSPNLSFAIQAHLLKLEHGSTAEYEIADLMKLCGWTCIKVNFDDLFLEAPASVGDSTQWSGPLTCNAVPL